MNILVLLSMNNLALALAGQEKFKEAEVIHREALQLRKRMKKQKRCIERPCSFRGREELVLSRKLLGDEHPDVALSKNNLVLVLFAQGKL